MVFSWANRMSTGTKTQSGNRESASSPLAACPVIPLREPPIVDRSDDELMQLASAGLDDAFALLVRRYQGQVRGYCSRRCGGAAAGDDVAQEVFVELWRTRARYEPRGKFRAYLYTIVQTRVLNAVQRRPREVELDHDIPLPGQELDAILEAERQRRLYEKLALLPGRLREALILRFSAGLDYGEMAEVLARSQSTVRSRVFHGLLRLRKLLGKERDQ
jgi:RNA polymerase sigma-70 factor, ECF subfamily